MDSDQWDLCRYVCSHVCVCVWDLDGGIRKIDFIIISEGLQGQNKPSYMGFGLQAMIGMEMGGHPEFVWDTTNKQWDKNRI